MKALILSLVIFLLLSCAQSNYTPVAKSSSCLKKYDSKLKKNIYSYVDEFPEFPGGLHELMMYISKNRSLTDENATQATLKFEIVVDIDGAIIDESIPGKDSDAYTDADKELLKILRLMPKWKPGECKNRKVPFRYPFRISVHPSY